jgi:hypothetical protein
LKDPGKKPFNFIQWNVSRFLGRLLSAVLVVIAIFYFIGPYYMRLMMPVFIWEIEMLSPHYRVVENDIITINKSDYLQLDIEVNKPMPEGRQGAGISGHVTRHKAQAGSLCIVPIIIFSLILAWPSIPISRRLTAFLFSIPLIGLIELLDYPVIFISNIASVYSDNILFNTLLKIWSHILNNGGRQFLALIAFCILIAPYYLNHQQNPLQSIDAKTSPPGKNAPCPCGSGKKYKNCCRLTSSDHPSPGN